MGVVQRVALRQVVVPMVLRNGVVMSSSSSNSESRREAESIDMKSEKVQKIIVLLICHPLSRFCTACDCDT